MSGLGLQEGTERTEPTSPHDIRGLAVWGALDPEQAVFGDFGDRLSFPFCLLAKDQNCGRFQA